MPSVVPWRFLLNPLNDSLSFYTTFRQAVITGVWSNLSNSGRERYLKGASFHLQYKLDELDLGTCIGCFNSIYHNKLPSYLALNSLANRCFTLVNNIDKSQNQLLELPNQFLGDSTYYNNENLFRHLLIGEIIYKLSSLHGILNANINVSNALNQWLNNFERIDDKRHLLLSIFMATNVNIENVVTTLSKYITELSSESLDSSDRFLLLYIIAKLSHLNSISGGSFTANNFSKYIKDIVEIPIDGVNDAVKILAVESISLLNECEFNLESGQIDKLISIENNRIGDNSESLLQMLVDHNIKSPVLWEESYKKNPIRNLSTYLLESYIKYKRNDNISSKFIPLDKADMTLSSVRDGDLFKIMSKSKDDLDLFLQVAKRYRQMIRGRIVKVEPCGLYVEISTNDSNTFITGYVDITTFPGTFEERLDQFFAPGNHFYVRIIKIPTNYEKTIEFNDVVNQVFIKSNDNLISLEPANLDFDVNAVKKRMNQQRQNIKKLKGVTFSKGDMVNATTIVCHNTYEWALFKLQCLKTGNESRKLGVLDTKNIRGDPIEKLRLLRKIEQGQPFKIKVTGTTGPLYSLNYSKMVQSAT